MCFDLDIYVSVEIYLMNRILFFVDLVHIIKHGIDGVTKQFTLIV